MEGVQTLPPAAWLEELETVRRVFVLTIVLGCVVLLTVCLEPWWNRGAAYRLDRSVNVRLDARIMLMWAGFLLAFGGAQGLYKSRNVAGRWARRKMSFDVAALYVVAAYCFSRGLFAFTVMISMHFASKQNVVSHPVSADVYGYLSVVVSAFAALLTTMLFWLRNRRHYTPIDNAPGCQECGYNLTRNTSGVCPECGHPTS